MVRSALVSALALAAAGAAPGCFLTPEYAFVEAGDVMIEPVRGAEFRAAGEYGDIYAISMQSAHEVSGWIAVVVDMTGQAIDLLDDFPTGSDDEGRRVYGPYAPRGSEVSWLFRLDGDEAAAGFEVFVGASGAEGVDEMQRLLHGSIEISEARRKGAFDLDFDVLEAHGDALKIGPDRDRRYTGTVALTFERDLETDHKRVDIDYDDFSVTQEVPIREYFAATAYRFHREADGSGEFHVDIASTFQAMLWSGPEVERAVIDMDWNPDGAGRARGEITSEFPGDLLLGDFALEECFDEQGGLIWREVNAAYAAALPGYNRGDPSRCAE